MEKYEYLNVRAERFGGIEVLFPDWKKGDERLCLYSPHDDDAILGAGYAMRAAMDDGAEVYVIIVCSGDCGYSTPEEKDTIVGRAMNRRIREGVVIMLGVGPRRDGLTACERVSVVAVDRPDKLTDSRKYWFAFVEGAYRVGLEEYRRVAQNDLPANLQEQALVDDYAARSEEVSRRYGKPIDMTQL